MEKLTLAFGATILTLGALFISIILGTLTGAIAGWVVGLFFGDTILYILSQLHVQNVTMWQFGAFLGFVGGFMKTKVTA